MRKNGYARGLLLTLAVFAALFLAGGRLIEAMTETSLTEQTELVRSAVRNSIVSCYAIEGCYPQDIDYLKENYGLTYDEDTFIVYYDAFASNIMPEVTVMVKGAEAE